MTQRLPALALAVACAVAALYGFVKEFGCNSGYDAHKLNVCGNSAAGMYDFVLGAAAVVAVGAVVRASTRIAGVCLAVAAAALVWGLRSVPA